MKENKLIAEFMGYVNTTPTDKDFNIYEHPETKKLIETMSMQFHTSWDWLMPVIDKIKSINKKELGNCDDIIDDLMMYLQCIDLFNTYQAVVEFIKWYNKQKEGDE